MPEKIVVLVTAGSLREGRRIAQRLVESRLAACVSITAVRSVYRWEEKIADEREFLLFIKTIRERFAEIQSAVLGMHSYSTPEIISLPIVEGSPAYLQWLEDSVTRGTPS